ncbi:hypothetical protein KA005_10130, partial [bacterium]|nr:hypothetical protein [bacterium]
MQKILYSVVFLFLASFFVFNFSGKYLSRAMLCHDLGFMYNAIPQIILSHSSQEDLDLNAKIELINNYIYYNVH